MTLYMYNSWDPIFQPKGFIQIYAEMDKHTKNAISHRYKSLQVMMEYFNNNVNTLAIPLNVDDSDSNSAVENAK